MQESHFNINISIYHQLFYRSDWLQNMKLTVDSYKLTLQLVDQLL
jgi:hypothetical protein